MTQTLAQSPAVVTGRTSWASKLARSAKRSDARLDQFRRQRTRFLREFAGRQFGEQWRQHPRMPLQLIYSIATIMEPSLALRNVKASVIARQASNQFFADMQTAVLDHQCARIKATQTLREAVRDSLFMMGAVKTGIDAVSGKMYCDPISMDDYILDANCRVRKPGAYAFEGHRFRMPYEQLMDSDLLDQRAKNIVTGLKNERDRRPERAEKLSNPQRSVEDDDFSAEVELCEFFIPSRNQIVWLPGDLDKTVFSLLEREWYGAEDGPIDVLGYSFMPDNAIPVPLMAVIYDLYILENELARKMFDQAKRQKDFIVGPKDPKDTRTVRDVQDGQYVQLNSPTDQVKPMSTGGVNETNFASLSYFHDFLVRLSGNMELKGGIKAQSGTLGQDQILLANANLRTNDMRSMVLDMASSVMGKLAWYIWNDPAFTAPVDVWELPVRWVPNYRRGEMSDYTYRVAAHSRDADDPETRYQRIKDLLASIIIPLAGPAAQQGSFPNVDAITNLAGRLIDVDQIEDLWIEGQPVQNPAPVAAAPQGQSQGGGMPAMRPGKAPAGIEDMGLAAMEAGK